MDLKRLETLGLIEKIGPDHKFVLAQLERARRDLLTSAANLPIDDVFPGLKLKNPLEAPRSLSTRSLTG